MAAAIAAAALIAASGFALLLDLRLSGGREGPGDAPGRCAGIAPEIMLRRPDLLEGACCPVAPLSPAVCGPPPAAAADPDALAPIETVVDIVESPVNTAPKPARESPRESP